MTQVRTATARRPQGTCVLRCLVATPAPGVLRQLAGARGVVSGLLARPVAVQEIAVAVAAVQVSLGRHRHPHCHRWRHHLAAPRRPRCAPPAAAGACASSACACACGRACACGGAHHARRGRRRHQACGRACDCACDCACACAGAVTASEQHGRCHPRRPHHHRRPGWHGVPATPVPPHRWPWAAARACAVETTRAGAGSSPAPWRRCPSAVPAPQPGSARPGAAQTCVRRPVLRAWLLARPPAAPRAPCTGAGRPLQSRPPCGAQLTVTARRCLVEAGGGGWLLQRRHLCSRQQSPRWSQAQAQLQPWWWPGGPRGFGGRNRRSSHPGTRMFLRLVAHPATPRGAWGRRRRRRGDHGEPWVAVM